MRRDNGEECPACHYADCYHRAPTCEKCGFDFRQPHVPARVVRRMLAAAQKIKNGALVIPLDGGNFGKVYDLASYLKMQQVAKENRPSDFRRVPASPLDPLGGVKGKVRGTLSRQDIDDQ